MNQKTLEKYGRVLFDNPKANFKIMMIDADSPEDAKLYEIDDGKVKILDDDVKGDYWCGGCGGFKADVEPRFSYGVPAGKRCKECCYGYRDHCGIDQPQGSPAELEAMGETYYSEEEMY